MSKKLFTLLLVAMFALAQFSAASAVAVAGDASITNIPTFANAVSVDVDWAVTGMAAGTKNVLIWSRIQNAVPVAYSNCTLIATIIGTSDASGTFTYTLPATVNGDVVEFIVTVDDDVCGGGTEYIPVAGDDPMGDTTVDTFGPVFWKFNPPTKAVTAFDATPVACNTFEMWALGTDRWLLPSTIGYSGIGDWKPSVTGSFAVPAPIGPAEDLFSWPFALPATASGAWTFSVYPEDMAGNQSGGGPYYFRNAYGIQAGETDDCTDFPDMGGHEYELYVRYLATLGLVSGFADGTFGPDNTLTRAEAATLIEISNGYDETTLPAAPTAACTFTDVAATDWFAGWVWQACADGYMNGIGGGLFDPNNLLTRGQIVTILNNVADASPLFYGGFIGTGSVVAVAWGSPAPYPLRTAAWTDVSIGAYYATPVVQAYGWGVAEGTSATTFSPDQPVTRGEFASMLYRALSRIG